MPSPVIALGAGSVVSGIAQASAAKKAASAQTDAAYASIAEQQRQFNVMQETLSPYVEAGNTATSSMLALLGLSGTDAQTSAIEGITSGASYQAQLAAGENAILKNAAATGGLRTGNTQTALSQYAPQLLASNIQSQYSNLSTLANMGQNAAAGVASGALSTGQSIGNTLTQAGQATASGYTNSANALSSTISNLSGLYGAYTANPKLYGGSVS